MTTARIDKYMNITRERGDPTANFIAKEFAFII
jgi:hypothetical protein